ncbi:MAG: hypothetical protein MUC91_02845 [Verrucomicrobia bacterium]|nr:hypothetical protein [Verrucomicrobiota bacterium]
MKRSCFFLLHVVMLAVVLANKAHAVTNLVSITPHMMLMLRGWRDSHSQERFRSDEEIHYGLVSTSTNEVFCSLIAHDEWFDFELYDSQGHAVEKTPAGNAASKAPSKPYTTRQRKYRSILDNSYVLFRPDEMFIITNSGTYRLEVRLRLCVPMTNGVPNLEAMTNRTSFMTASQFGLLISDPVCAEVVKE